MSEAERALEPTALVVVRSGGRRSLRSPAGGFRDGGSRRGLGPAARRAATIVGRRLAGGGAPAPRPSRLRARELDAARFPRRSRPLLGPLTRRPASRRLGGATSAGSPQPPSASRSARASGRSLIAHSAGFVGAVSSSTVRSSRRASATCPCFRRTLARPIRRAVKRGSTSSPLRKCHLRTLQASSEDPRDLVVDVPCQRVGGRQPGVEIERLADRLAYLRQEEQRSHDALRLTPAPRVDPEEQVGERRAGRQLDRPSGRLPPLGVGGELLLGGGGPDVEAGAGERDPGLRIGRLPRRLRETVPDRIEAHGVLVVPRGQDLELRDERRPRSGGARESEREEEGGGAREGDAQHVAARSGTGRSLA